MLESPGSTAMAVTRFTGPLRNRRQSTPASVETNNPPSVPAYTTDGCPGSTVRAVGDPPSGPSDSHRPGSGSATRDGGAMSQQATNANPSRTAARGLTFRAGVTGGMLRGPPGPGKHFPVAGSASGPELEQRDQLFGRGGGTVMPAQTVLEGVDVLLEHTHIGEGRGHDVADPGPGPIEHPRSEPPLIDGLL